MMIRARKLYGEDDDPYAEVSGPAALLVAIIERARRDVTRTGKGGRNAMGKHQLSAAWYFGNDMFEHHAELVGVNADAYRERRLAGVIPPSPLSLADLRRIHGDHVLSGKSVVQCARWVDVSPLTLAYQWGRMGLEIKENVKKGRPVGTTKKAIEAREADAPPNKPSKSWRDCQVFIRRPGGYPRRLAVAAD